MTFCAYRNMIKSPVFFHASRVMTFIVTHSKNCKSLHKGRPSFVFNM